MPLNAKVAAEIDRQVTAGTMTTDYAAQLKGTFANAPDEFQAGFLAGPDYNRNSQALKAERDAFEDTKTQWKTWKSTADEEYANMQAKVTELETKLSAGGGTNTQNVDWKKELDTLKVSLINDFKAQGFVTKSEYEKELAKAKQEGVGMMGDILDQQRKIESQYNKDFGKQFDPMLHNELVTIANETAAKQGRYVPLEDAYKIKFGEDVKKLEQERWMAEGKKQAAEEFARNNVPGGGGGNGMPGGAQMGPLQIRLAQTQGKDFTSTDGDLQSAKASAVEALRAAR